MSESHSLSGMTPEQKRELLAQLLREKAAKTKVPAAMSFGQRALWFIHQVAPESAAYHIGFFGGIYSEVDVPALKRALQTLMDRHEALRMTFSAQGGIPAAELYEYRENVLEQVDASGWDEGQLREAATAAYQTPFDFEHGPLIRWTLFTRSAKDHLLLMVVHHIVFDGWSNWLLLDELRQLYAAEAAGNHIVLPSPKKQYKDFVQWQENLLSSPEGDRLRQYWHEQLSGASMDLNLPVDMSQTMIQSYAGASHAFVLSDELATAIRTLAQAENTTLYNVLLAVFQVLLHRYSGQEDILIGSPFAGRSRAEFSSTVGYFVNPVVLRSRFDSTLTFSDFLRETRQTVLDAMAHQDYPFIKLVEELAGRQDFARSPIFQAAFNLIKVQRPDDPLNALVNGQPGARTDFGGLILETPYYPQQEGQFELELDFVEIGKTVRGALKYKTDLFEPATIERMWGHFHTLLTEVVADPARQIGKLPLVTQAEQHQLAQWNSTETDYPQDAGVHQLFEAQVERTPDAAAVEFEGEVLTYRELNDHANQLAHYLRKLGAGPGALLGVCMERTPEMLVALLGILKAGGAYVPMDPDYPAERLGYMLEDGRMSTIITRTNLLNRLPEHQSQIICLDTDWEHIADHPTANPQVAVMGDDRAYVIFTSGSTGRPKGVQIPHRALTNFLLSMQKEPGITQDDVLASVTTLSFDIAGLELYLPLISGARVVIVSRETASDGRRLAEVLDTVQATLFQATPITYRLLIEAGWQGRKEMKMLVGGEAVPRNLVDSMLEWGGEVWNMYGPTETTIWSTICRLTADERLVSIGRPIANTQIYVLDSALQPVPVGVPGSLYIGGDGLAQGYINRPDLTAERFVPNPFGSPDSLIYNTGDLARYLPDGRLEHLGRVDHQVKIRGYRIELGEIEAVMNKFPGVAASVVVAREDTPGDARLAAYIVGKPQTIVSVTELRDQVRQVLPEYMLPSVFMQIEQMPLTPNGKVDRKALPAPDYGKPEREQVAVVPQTPTEMLMSEVWREVLNTDEVSVYDNFFDLGGHSLMAIQVISKMEAKIGVKMDPALIRFQTLGQLAASYDELLAQRGSEPAPAPAPGGLTQRLFKALRRNPGSAG